MPVVKIPCGYVVCKVIDRMETATQYFREVIELQVYENVPQRHMHIIMQLLKGRVRNHVPTYERQYQIQAWKVSGSLQKKFKRQNSFAMFRLRL